MQNKSELRIVSLLPSATEIVCALGLEENLVGITHECDFPLSIVDKPHLTASRISHETMASAEIDYAVETIKVNVTRLRELSPLWDMYKEGIDISTIQWAAH